MSDQKKIGYAEEYSDDNFWEKLKKAFKKAGIKVVYSALMLYYAYQKKETPIWAKSIIIGALGYFIVPLDAIPDLAPVVGYADDLGVLAAAIAAVGVYIDSDVKESAKSKLKDWFGAFDEAELL